jgi:signal peptidase II
MTGAPISYLKRAEDWAARARSSRLFQWSLFGGSIVALADQWSKQWILQGVKLPERQNGHVEISGLFDLTFVRNFGASFGMLAGTPIAPFLLSLVALAVTVGIIHWLPNATRRLTVAGLALIMGGAVGNLIDRLRFGYVVDFLNFSGFPFPHIRRIDEFPFFTIENGGFIWVFNVADAAINVGIALLVLDWWLQRKKGSGAVGRLLEGS